MYYTIEDTLKERTLAELSKVKAQYVAVLTPNEWQALSGEFDMGIDLDLDVNEIHHIKAEENYDSLTGTFVIPDRKNLTEREFKFAFALDEKGIVFIDPSGRAAKMVKWIQRTKKWQRPSLERFLYDFLSSIVYKDAALMERYEKELDKIENDILDDEGDTEEKVKRVNEVRGKIRELLIHYEQLMDFSHQLEENDNGFFDPENDRYFQLFSERIDRLKDSAASIRDYAVQVRGLYQGQLDVKQNHVMTILTVVTVIFMPLTLIVGWYGMNFRYMPELDEPWGYPAVMVVSLMVIIGSLIFFKKKKWL